MSNYKKMTVIVIAYNHEKYIDECIESILMQNTKEAFRIIIFDDASTDKTREKINKFKLENKNIETVYPEKNTYNSGRKITHDLIEMCDSEYLAILEGDDAWTDENKLKKQIDFLDRNQEFVMATHDITSIDENSNVLCSQFLPDYYRADFSSKDLMKCWGGIMVQSAVFRNIPLDIPDEFHKCFSGDLFLACLYGAHGKSKFMDDIKPSLYRQHGNGIFTSLDPEQRKDIAVLNYYWLYRYYKRIKNSELSDFYKTRIGQKLGLIEETKKIF